MNSLPPGSPGLRNAAPSARLELRAIKAFTLTHAIGVLLFVALMIGFFYTLHRVESESSRQSLYRDIEWGQQSLRLYLRDLQDELLLHASDWTAPSSIELDPAKQVGALLSQRQEVLYMATLDTRQRIRWTIPGRGDTVLPERSPGVHIEDTSGFSAAEQAMTSGKATWSAPFSSSSGQTVVELYLPVGTDRRNEGSLMVGISLERLLGKVLPEEIRARYALSLVDQGGNRLVSSSPRHSHDESLLYEVPLDPPGHGVRLRAIGFSTQTGLIERWLLLAVVGLSIASLVSLMLLWRHARRRVAAEVERDRMFTLSIDPMVILNRRAQILRANPAFEQLLGGDSQGRHLASLAIASDRSIVDQALESLNTRASKTQPIPANGPGANADSIEFEARFGPIHAPSWLRWAVRRDPDPNVQTLYAVAHDTTVRKATESALVAETAFRRAMEDSMLTGMRAFDMQGRITFVNRAFCAMTGYQEDELLLKDPPYPYWPEGDIDNQMSNLDMVLAGEAPIAGFQVQVQRKDMTLFEARMYVSPLIDGAGQQSGWMTSMTDITEPNRIRRELADAQERFITVLEELDTAVCVGLPGDHRQGLLFANRAYRSAFGDLVVVPLDQRNTEAQELELLGASGSRWYDLRMRPIRWVDDRLVIMVVATDITERRASERLQRDQEAKLQHTARLVTMGEMASSLAHELNQPLTAIANYSMGLAARVRTRTSKGQSLDAVELLEMLGKTAAQAERAGKVIRRIREFVKRSEPERRDCDAATLINDAIVLAEIDARRHAIQLRLEIAPKLPTLHADPILIEQVLVNLMKNAIEAMRTSKRRQLTIQAHRLEGHIEFVVTDTGSGLASEIVDRLFEPFYTTKPEGMGMGLNICRSVVEAHAGRLWVESNPGGAGCTFRFTLPLPNNVAVLLPQETLA